MDLGKYTTTQKRPLREVSDIIGYHGIVSASIGSNIFSLSCSSSSISCRRMEVSLVIATAALAVAHADDEGMNTLPNCDIHFIDFCPCT